MKATRDGFGKKLEELGNNPSVIVLSADLSSPTKTDGFQRKYPDRFFEVGIAENNMIGIASGLAEYPTNKVFLSSFSSFLTSKYESIRTAIAYSKSPVIMVGTHAGLAIGRDGVTQMGLEDVALMRALPNMMVLQPATPLQAEAMTEYLINNDLESPVYLRLGRQPCPEFFDETYKFSINDVNVLVEGKDVILFTSGCILDETLKAEKILRLKGVSTAVINVPVLKPLQTEKILEYSRNAKLVCAVEDHSIIGGLGSAICEVLSENNPTKVIRFGVMDVFPESGVPEDLWKKYGLTGDQIAQRVLCELS